MDQELKEANEARVARLNGVGIPVPLDEMRIVSYLEFLLGDRLDEANDHHERRIAPILALAEANLEVRLEGARKAATRNTLLKGVTTP